MAEYLERFSPSGQGVIRSRLDSMFAHTRTTHPGQITTRQLNVWIVSARANNTVRSRLSTSRTFLRWCLLRGFIESNPADLLPEITRQYPTTYGKVQDKNPARFLTYDEAFGQLVGVCQDGTDVGLRDEIIIRLGLAGMRRAEIANLTVGHMASLPTITWLGKGRKTRHLVAGSQLHIAITAWLDLRLQHECSDDPRAGLFQRRKSSRPDLRTTPNPIQWNAPHGIHMQTIHDVVTSRARQAGLGHVAPHDLRRSAASILHRSTTADGAHRFDLLDIQRVLGHADPATTMRSYLEPMDTETTCRASKILD
jgi:integrase